MESEMSGKVFFNGQIQMGASARVGSSKRHSERHQRQMSAPHVHHWLPGLGPGPPGSEGWMFSALGQGCWLAYVCEMEQKGGEYGGPGTRVGWPSQGIRAFLLCQKYQHQCILHGF